MYGLSLGTKKVAVVEVVIRGGSSETAFIKRRPNY